MKKIINEKKGFTLIELLVVVAIIGVLATVVVSNLSQARRRAKVARLQSDVRAIQQAIYSAHLDSGNGEIWASDNNSGGALLGDNFCLNLARTNGDPDFQKFLDYLPADFDFTNPLNGACYRYDHDRDDRTLSLDACPGPWARGVNILIAGLDYEDQVLVDLAYDGIDSPYCGKVGYEAVAGIRDLAITISPDGIDPS